MASLCSRQFRRVEGLDSRLPPVDHGTLSLVCGEVRAAAGAILLAPPVPADLPNSGPRRARSSLTGSGTGQLASSFSSNSSLSTLNAPTAELVAVVTS